METVGVDRLNALYTAIELVRRGGTISLSGVYGGMADPMPHADHCSTSRSSCGWGRPTSTAGRPTSCRCCTDGDPLGVEDFATHRLPLEAAPDAYATFQARRDGMVKTLLQPAASPQAVDPPR